MELTRNEKFQIQYLLPIQGNLETLKTVQQILDKLNIIEEDQNNKEIIDIDFNSDEINFLKYMVQILDQNQKLFLSSLSLVNKILI
jgi:hypothetical protein